MSLEALSVVISADMWDVRGVVYGKSVEALGLEWSRRVGDERAACDLHLFVFTPKPDTEGCVHKVRMSCEGNS